MQSWSDSVLQTLYDAIHAVALTTTGGASLVHQAKVDIVTVPNLSEHLSSVDGDTAIEAKYTGDFLFSPYDLLAVTYPPAYQFLGASLPHRVSTASWNSGRNPFRRAPPLPVRQSGSSIEARSWFRISGGGDLEVEF